MHSAKSGHGLPLYSAAAANSRRSSSEVSLLGDPLGGSKHNDGLRHSSSSPSTSPSSLAQRASKFWAGQPGRRRILPLVVLSLLSLVLVASTDGSAESTSFIASSPSSSRANQWLGTIIRRPSKSVPRPVTSDITADDGDADRVREWKSPTPALPLDASLRERLQDLWDAPLAEPANWVQWNMQTCSRERVKQTQNDWLTQDAAYTWHSLNSTDVKSKRKAMIDYLVQAEKQGLMEPAKAGIGRGLVFTAGNADTFSRVLMTLKMLKKYYNTTLPAEIFSFPGEMPPEDLIPQFKEYNATLRYIEDASRDTSRTKNYQIKSDAIVASSFAEVLYLDSDNMPAAHLGNHDGTFDANLTTERELIWNAPAYKRLGAMFWPDYWKTGPMNPIWGIIGTQCRDEWEQEAGQILIDKRRHMDALLLSNWMLDDWQFWFRLSDGDKDIFRFAFLALRKRWAVPGRYVGAGALPGNTMSGFCGHTMMQHDHLGEPMFIHANLLKQIPSGVGKGYTWGRTRQTSLFNGGDPAIEGGEGSGDVEADQLANAGADGTAILPAVNGVRLRAAFERGVYTRFHGGVTSALCVDLHYEDPRTKEEKAKDAEYEAKHPNKAAAKGDEGGKKDSQEEGKSMVTWGKGLHGEEIAIDWDVSPLMVGYWRDMPRLANYEQHFYEEGGKPNGRGF